MTDYNDGKWHGWNGGGCPLNDRTVVDAVWHNPITGSVGKYEGVIAGGISEIWNHVIKFRVTKRYVAPYEWWIVTDKMGRFLELCETKEQAEHNVGMAVGGIIIHVREVIE